MLSEGRREGRCGARWDELQRAARHLGLVSLPMYRSWGLRTLAGDGFTYVAMRSNHLRHELKALLGKIRLPHLSLPQYLPGRAGYANQGRAELIRQCRIFSRAASGFAWWKLTCSI